MRYSFGGIILVLFGVLILFDNLDMLDFGEVIETFWPLLLILWGAMILYRRQNQPTVQNTEQATYTQYETQQTVPSEIINESNIFGDIFLSVSSQSFKGGSVHTVFGNSDVDLSKASFAEGDHILRVQGVFGNCKIILAKDAAVAISAGTTFGKLIIFGQRKDGFSSTSEIATVTFPGSTARLKIIISKVFGDVIVA